MNIVPSDCINLCLEKIYKDKGIQGLRSFCKSYQDQSICIKPLIQSWIEIEKKDLDTLFLRSLFEKLLVLDPKDEISWLNYITFELTAGNVALAGSLYSKALGILGDSASFAIAYNNLLLDL